VNGDQSPDGELGPRAAALAALARRELGQLAPAAQERGLGAVRARLALRRRRWAWSLGIGGLAAAAAMALVVPRLVHRRGEHEGPPLAFQVDDAALSSDGVIQAAAGMAPALRFGDGTVIAFRPGTQGRLASVDARGAHVAISDGTAAVSVVPRPHARWQIDAGPFSIHVHGTVFTAAWNAAEKRLDVKLQRGAVSVDGPLATGAISMRTGQRLTVSLRESRVLLRPMDEDDAPVAAAEPTEAAAPAPAPVTRAPAPRGPEHALREPRENREPREVRPAHAAWPAALAAGDFAAIVDEASRDLVHVLRTASSEDLAALADAARYQRQDDLARRALEAQRQRFHGSPRATDAAFFLGRLDENGGGGLIRALHWYDRYLEEAPSGPYAAEALGRRMVALRELYGVTAARPVAESYVHRFPRGSYAGAAQALLGQ
jgi:hypothetical protein